MTQRLDAIESEFSRRDTFTPQSPDFGDKFQPGSFLAANLKRSSTLTSDQFEADRLHMRDQEVQGKPQKPLPKPVLPPLANHH